MPRGGVVNARRPGRRPGRSEAESIDDAEPGASIDRAMVRRADLDSDPREFRVSNVGCRRPDCWRSIDSFCSAKSGHEYMHTCGALIRHRSVRSDMDLRHGHRWRERPRLGGLGSLVGQDSGVVHAIVRAATPTPAPALTAAQSAASRARSHEVAARAVVAGSSPSYAHQG